MIRFKTTTTFMLCTTVLSSLRNGSMCFFHYTKCRNGREKKIQHKWHKHFYKPVPQAKKKLHISQHKTAQTSFHENTLCCMQDKSTDSDVVFNVSRVHVCVVCSPNRDLRCFSSTSWFQFDMSRCLFLVNEHDC